MLLSVIFVSLHRMNRILIVGLALFQMLCTNAVGQDADAILGKWLDEEQETIIEIYKENDTYNGRIVWLMDSLDVFGGDLRDVLNDDTQLRSRKVIGTNMLQGFVWDEAGTWRKGGIYYYHSGNRYNGKIYMSEDGKLKLKGYYSFLFFLGKTKTWTRFENNNAASRK